MIPVKMVNKPLQLTSVADLDDPAEELSSSGVELIDDGDHWAAQKSWNMCLFSVTTLHKQFWVPPSRTGSPYTRFRGLAIELKHLISLSEPIDDTSRSSRPVGRTVARDMRFSEGTELFLPVTSVRYSLSESSTTDGGCVERRSCRSHLYQKVGWQFECGQE